MNDNFSERRFESRSLIKYSQSRLLRSTPLIPDALPACLFPTHEPPKTLLLRMVLQIVHQHAFVTVQAHRIDPYTSNRESKDPQVSKCAGYSPVSLSFLFRRGLKLQLLNSIPVAFRYEWLNQVKSYKVGYRSVSKANLSLTCGHAMARIDLLTPSLDANWR